MGPNTRSDFVGRVTLRVAQGTPTTLSIVRVVRSNIPTGVMNHDQHERGSFLHHMMAKVNTLVRIEYGVSPPMAVPRTPTHLPTMFIGQEENG